MILGYSYMLANLHLSKSTLTHLFHGCHGCHAFLIDGWAHKLQVGGKHKIFLVGLVNDWSGILLG
jgi:hypothetical protein